MNAAIARPQTLPPTVVAVLVTVINTLDVSVMPNTLARSMM